MRTIFILLLCLSLYGCSTLGTVKRTNELLPGMTISEVKKILGQPSQTQFIGDKLVLKYNLHQYWKGWAPYYLAFDKNALKLESWFSDEEEYYRNQQMWIESMPKQINVNANVKENIELKGDMHHDVDIRNH